MRRSAIVHLIRGWSSRSRVRLDTNVNQEGRQVSVLGCEAFTLRPLGTPSPALRHTAPDGLVFRVRRQSGHGFAIGGKFQELLRRGHRPPSRLSPVYDSEHRTGAEVPHADRALGERASMGDAARNPGGTFGWGASLKVG